MTLRERIEQLEAEVGALLAAETRFEELLRALAARAAAARDVVAALQNAARNDPKGGAR